MKLTVERMVVAGLVTVLLLMAGIGLISYLSINRLVDNTKLASDNLKIRGHAQDVLLTMLNVEAGSRGYVITGQDPYLEPYRNAVDAVGQQMAELSHSLGDAPGQQQRFRELQESVASKLAIAKRNVESRQNQGFEAAASQVKTGNGRKEMDEIRAMVVDITSYQDKLMSQQNLQGEQQARQTIWTIGLGGISGFLFVAGACWVIHRDLRRRRVTEEQLQNFFMLSLDMLCIAGTDGYFKRINPVWEKTLGYDDDELLRTPYVEFVHPDDRASTIAAAKQVTEGGHISRFRNRYRCRDGSYRWFMWSASVSSDGLQHFASARDITDEKRAEDEIAALNKTLVEHNTQLESINNELEAFSYSVSHDLRSPLRSLDGFSQALMEDCGDKLDSEGQDNLLRIRRASQRMGQLIDDLLNLSRLTRADMNRQIVDLSKLAKETAEEIRATDATRDVEFVIADGLEVEGDPRLLAVLLTNLLGNAWKFTARRPHTRIELGSIGANSSREFFVRDNGVGFDMAYAGKLFGAFQRLHAMNEFPGTGIGLATVQRIVSRHGGRVWAESAVEAGATFHFTL